MTSSNRVVFFNGEFVPESEARISIYDSALMFGDMVFEMTRSFKGKQFKLREHLERLYCSIRMVHIPLEMTIDEMEAAVLETIRVNHEALAPDDEYRVMVDVSRGLLGIYENTVAVRKGPNVIIAVFPLRWTVRGMGRLFEHGINAVVPSQRAIPADLLDPKIKNRSRLHYLMANVEVSQVKGEDNWALLLDPDGYVAEGTGDNFFIVKDKQIITPEGRNILRGISRDYVLEELAPKLGLPVYERNIGLYDVVNADEAFMTGTPFSMLPVCTINGSRIGRGTPGEITTALLNQWSLDVSVDIPGQIKAWDATAGAATSSAPTPYSFRRKAV